VLIRVPDNTFLLLESIISNLLFIIVVEYPFYSRVVTKSRL